MNKWSYLLRLLRVNMVVKSMIFEIFYKKLLTYTWWHDILIKLLIELLIKRNSKLIKFSSWQADLIYVIINVLIGCLISQRVDLWKLNKVSTNQMCRVFKSRCDLKQNICEVNSLNNKDNWELFKFLYILYESLILAQDERRRCA